MKINILLILVFTISISSAQTNVSGNQYGTWTAANSPYQVTGNITVPTGQILTIEAGVEVNFQGYYEFTIDGKVLANGNEIGIINFTTDNQSVGWGGIKISQTTEISEFIFCRFEYGKTSSGFPDNHGGAILLQNANSVFSYCVFADNDATGDNDGMGGAVYGINTGSESSTLTSFIDCKFIRNHAYGSGGAVRLSDDNNTEFINCEFIENNCLYGGGAISFGGVADVKMTRCLFANNYTEYSSGGAIHTIGPITNIFSFTNCTITKNEAHNGDAGAVELAYSDANFVNCIVFDNPGMYSDDIFIDSGGSANINYSNLTMPSGATGTNNIQENPLFVDITNGDFHLQSTSPCIDAGTDVGFAYTGAAPDMGCYEYVAVGINDYQTNTIVIYPNPTNNTVSFEEINNLEEITLIDSTGKKVADYSVDYLSRMIDLSKLTTGVYFIRFKTDNGILSRKIIRD